MTDQSIVRPRTEKFAALSSLPRAAVPFRGPARRKIIAPSCLPRTRASEVQRAPQHALAKDRDAFFEQVIGIEPPINSTGSLWGLQQEGDTTVFVG